MDHRTNGKDTRENSGLLEPDAKPDIPLDGLNVRKLSTPFSSQLLTDGPMPRSTATLEAHRDALERERETARQRHDASVQLEDQRFGPSSVTCQLAQRDLHAATERFERLALEHGVGQEGLPLYIYLLFMFGLAIAEVPINKTAVELLLSTVPLVGLLVAVLLGIVLITFGHFCGKWARQSAFKPALSGKLAAVGGAAALFMIALSIIVVVSLSRVEYLSLALETDVTGLFGDRVDSSPQGIKIYDIPLSVWTLLILNAGLLLCSTILSINQHGIPPEVEESKLQVMAAQAHLQALVEQYNVARKKLLSQLQDDQRALDKKVAAVMLAMAQHASDHHATSSVRPGVRTNLEPGEG